jgi:hypothetical protein
VGIKSLSRLGGNRAIIYRFNFSIKVFSKEKNHMTTEEIKTILHESIENIEDEKFLEAIRVILENKYKTIPSLKISEKHKKILDESSKQIEDGDYFTNEEAKKIANEWLKD